MQITVPVRSARVNSAIYDPSEDLPSRREPLQSQPNEVFGALRFLAALLNFPHRFVRLDLFVAERD